MRNALRYLYKHFFQSDEPHEISSQNTGVADLARDLHHFEATSQVPEGLTKHVVSSMKAQSNWYNKLLQAWKEAKPPPKTPEETSRFVIATLKWHQKAEVEGLLTFYNLPLPHTLLVDLSTGEPSILPSGLKPSTLLNGAKYELRTLPVDEKAVSDGDTITVYVSTADPRESSLVPKEVQAAVIQRSKACAENNHAQADELHKKITDQNYRVIPNQNEEVLAKKYRIRLSGIDAPESAMPYGKQAKEELTNIVQGKHLRVLIYNEDRYGRYVGDVYCNGTFAQEVMLKKGLAWHYTAYDHRTELANWEKEARAKRVGLWASKNPEAPWEWRKAKREGR